ncbi:neuronal membrane glycoprotein M6-b-like isoform X2 [Acanthaster planci]|uniref:Neuronal membrane glycoprotein M6-b-like isoform X2 n=1 Tax=Acanthaster planci TaxID=133434 RepID=A0A8B7ZIM6_ACAPL|nr:neuronal membrane glycoprotein M6-b-like isoform X2 [Acanthaster planci]XP_022103126.1 neuronal membrane glycoprotein M6-b-like isoform X2 [Acanthaster planci]
MEEGGCCDCALCRCLKRVPYGTLFALLLLFGGLALLTYQILNIRDVAKRMFAVDANFNSNSVLFEGNDTLFWVLIAAVAVMGLYGILLVVIACLTTGPSGQNTCGREHTRCIGLCSTDILIMITYVLCAVWIALTVVLAMPFTFMLMVRSYCKTSSTCIDLGHYGLVENVEKTATQNLTDYVMPVCGKKMENLCAKNASIWLSSFLAMASCIMIVISLIHFLMALSANHTYQKLLSGNQPTRSKYGNDYRRAYGDSDIPLQEPLNIHDESTRF